MALKQHSLGLFLACFCSYLLRTDALAPSTANSPSLTLLFQNTLNHTTNAISPQGFIVANDVPANTAEGVCQSLSEQVVDIGTLSLKASQDLVDLLRFQSLGSSQEFWVQNDRPSTQGGRCQTVRVVNGRLRLAIDSCAKRLPVVCTQSAPFSGQATSPNFQISVNSRGRQFTGFRNFASFRFFGIPFANPPNRFEYATLFSGTQTTFDNTVPGPHCFQANDANVSEDCLFLNVFTPFLPGGRDRSAKLKPVMFWIHGGAFTGGAGSDSIFDGGSLASRGDVVVVTTNYRLGTLGFLALDDGVINGNFGLADQIVALEWVQKHIADFGGDPNKVTIFGQSAGAGSVRGLLASPKAKGLFRAAIPMSNLAGLDFATTFSQYLPIPEEVATVANPIIAQTGCTNEDPAAVRACLLAVPAATFVKLPVVARFFVVDGTILTSETLPLTGKAPGVSKVPTLWGWMAFDGAPFIGFPKDGQTFEQALVTLGIVNQTLAHAIAQSPLFPVPSTGNHTLDIFNASAKVTTEVEFSCLDQATIVAAVENDVFESVFAYQFDRSYQTPGFSPNFPTCEAPITATHPLGDPTLPYLQCHSGELFYVFGTLGQVGLHFRDDEDLAFNQFILDTWASFARTFNPTPSTAFLEARGFQTTLQRVQSSAQWTEITKENMNGDQVLRRLNGPQSGFSAFVEKEQCEFVGFPFTFYL